MAGETAQSMTSLETLLDQCLAARRSCFDSARHAAFRLFNGFTEGNPDLVIDLYGSTVVLHNYADDVAHGAALVYEAQQFLNRRFSWLRAGIVKVRNAKTQSEKRGRLLFGDKPDRKIREHGIWYAVDLMMNRDASFYLDTRNLRHWLIQNARGKFVLNTFAYTGSLGVAAAAGGASRVVQLDLNRQFLNLAKESCALNRFAIRKEDFVAGDFFPAISRFKRKGETFDCVLIDPPFFSTTSKGKVDQVNESERLINKVRPLINDGGILIAINNALYLSGKEYMQTLEALCADGYLTIRELVSVPDDMVGYNRVAAPISDPSPFNHSTKIAILEVRRKIQSL
jgi:23S rRNA (cytosine1962-C5)-methyltransferase